MALDAALDPVEVLPRPLHRSLQALAQLDLGGEADLVPCLGRVAEALAGVVPVARGSQGDRRRVAGQLVDRLGVLADRGLGAAGQVVDLARLARSATPSARAMSPTKMKSRVAIPPFCTGSASCFSAL